MQPDIVYEYGNPGFSATDCVVAATLKAVEAASIDKKRLGLIGHSFGGYETNFIITQTDLFAAAVGSAGLTDFTSHYLSEYEGGKPNIWRFENQQMRMKVSLFEDYKGYWNNSVISHVSNIRTPLFTYTGMKDNNVPANQSYELYHAMRRLHKEHIFLVYPNETHNLIQPEHQLDISKRLTEWFGYYLKGEARPDWFNPK